VAAGVDGRPVGRESHDIAVGRAPHCLAPVMALNDTTRLPPSVDRPAMVTNTGSNPPKSPIVSVAILDPFGI
jgi:hypothetical protein